MNKQHPTHCYCCNVDFDNKGRLPFYCPECQQTYCGTCSSVTKTSPTAVGYLCHQCLFTQNTYECCLKNNPQVKHLTNQLEMWKQRCLKAESQLKDTK